jgi:drug/metabolite transporter (DMT)-like permease
VAVTGPAPGAAAAGGDGTAPERGGLALMAGSAFCFSLMSLSVKLAGARLPALELVFARAVVISALAGADLARRRVRLRSDQLGLLAVRGLVGFVSLSFYYYAVIHLPLAEATVIHYTHPVLAALLAAAFIGERMSGRELALACLGLAGVVLVVRPPGLAWPGGGLPVLPVASALACAVLTAVAYVLVRSLRGHDPMLVVFSFAGLSSLVAGPLMLPGAVWPEGTEWLLVLASGVSGFVAQALLTMGLQRERAGPATAMGYLQIVFAALWGAVVFADLPGPWTLAGAAVVVGCSLLMGRAHVRAGSRPAESGRTADGEASARVE